MNGAYFSQTSRTSSEVVNKFLKERMCKEKKKIKLSGQHIKLQESDYKKQISKCYTKMTFPSVYAHRGIRYAEKLPSKAHLTER